MACGTADIAPGSSARSVLPSVTFCCFAPQLEPRFPRILSRARARDPRAISRGPTFPCLGAARAAPVMILPNSWLAHRGLTCRPNPSDGGLVVAKLLAMQTALPLCELRSSSWKGLRIAAASIQTGAKSIGGIQRFASPLFSSARLKAPLPAAFVAGRVFSPSPKKIRESLDRHAHVSRFDLCSAENSQAHRLAAASISRGFPLMPLLDALDNQRSAA